MFKAMVRLSACLFGIALVFLLLVELLNASDILEGLQEQSYYFRVMLAILGSLAAIAAWFLYGFMFYHWGSVIFKNRFYKRLWFFSLLLGMFIGAFAYYVLVFELQLTDHTSRKIKEKQGN